MTTRNDADIVNHPPHYKGVSGVECIDAIEAMGCGAEFCRANAVKYLWRLGKKGQALEDAKKAQWYVNRLVSQLTGEPVKEPSVDDVCWNCGKRYGRHYGDWCSLEGCRNEAGTQFSYALSTPTSEASGTSPGGV